MIELTIAMAAFNANKLDNELKAALTNKYLSLSTVAQGQPVIVRLIDAASQADQDTAINVCAVHDPSPSPKLAWVMAQSPLVDYYTNILLSVYNDVDNGAVTLAQLLTNAANLIALNPTQAAKFNAYRTRLGIGGSIASLTAAQQGNLLALGLEWATAGLSVALSLSTNK